MEFQNFFIDFAKSIINDIEVVSSRIVVNQSKESDMPQSEMQTGSEYRTYTQAIQDSMTNTPGGRSKKQRTISQDEDNNDKFGNEVNTNTSMSLLDTNTSMSLLDDVIVFSE
ncbi:hypothetical protein Fot_15603 [Forsythia ovata]|uniref:Uncharacterized protein n=1 Tax=Forsythia ovata TaxID=205694 RepID=A0ABD1WA47_9LAMI